jgi:DNA-binding SARP family transcriptional activator/TolB-like protein
MIRLQLLGGVGLADSDGVARDDILAQPKSLALLAYLAIATPTGFRRRDELLGLFWPELDTQRGRRALSQSLFVLRNVLGADSIVARGIEEVAIDSAVVWSDAAAFRAAADARADDDAMALYRGDLLPAFHLGESPEFEQWLDRERRSLREKAAQAALRLAERNPSPDPASTSTKWARRATELAPYDERSFRRLATLLAQQGDRTAAIRAYDELRGRLQRDLEVEPSAETQSLVEGFRRVMTPLGSDSNGIVGTHPRHFGSQTDKSHVAEPPLVTTPDEELSATAGTSRDQRSRLSTTAMTFGVVAVVGIIGLRALGLVGSKAAPAAAARVDPQRLIVAQFTGTGRDTLLASTITDIIRLDLSRSPALDVLAPETVRNTLQLMRRDTLTPLTSTIVREVAQREALKAFVEGDIQRVGSAYVLSARLVTAKTGAVIDGWRAEAADSTGIIRAINRLSESIRSSAGESMESIAASSFVFRVSTTSLDALHLHMMGSRAVLAGDLTRARALFEEAIRIDSAFVDAHVMLATTLRLAGMYPARQIDAIRTAYAYRDRLTPAERYEVMAEYESRIRGDLRAAAAAYRNQAELAPTEVYWAALGSTLLSLGDAVGAERELTRGVRLFATPMVYAQLAAARTALGDFAGAEKAIDAAQTRFPGSAIPGRSRVDLAIAAGSYARADSIAHALRPGIDPRLDLSTRALIDAALGRGAEALEHLQALTNAQRGGTATGDPLETALLVARIRLVVLGDTAGALRTADDVLGSSTFKAADPRDRPYAALAHLFAESGRPRRATAMLADFYEHVPDDYRVGSRALVTRTAGMIDVLESRTDSGLARLRDAVSPGPNALPALAALAWAYERAGMTDSAAAVWRRYRTVPTLRRLDADAFALTAARH